MFINTDQFGDLKGEEILEWKNYVEIWWEMRENSREIGRENFSFSKGILGDRRVSRAFSLVVSCEFEGRRC